MNDLKVVKEALALASNSGVFLYVEAGKLKFKSKSGALTDELKGLLKAYKSQIIELLSSEESALTGASAELPEIERLQLKQAQLSFSQQRLWFVDKMEGGSTQYNLPLALRIEGAFDVDAAEQAMTQIIARHESLRTVFREDSGGPMQVIQDEFEFRFERHDLTALDACDDSTANDSEQQQAITELMQRDTDKVFDLGSDLMIRGSYLYLNNDVGILLLNMHHIASDGWSAGLLINEFIAHYQALTGQNELELPQLEVQYSDYAHWQRQWLEGAVLDTQLDYWKNQLDEAPVIHSLPLDFPRPANRAHTAGMVNGHISSDFTERLQQLAQQQQVTLFMLLHGVLSLVISRHSFNHDIIIGTPLANRHQKELDPLIGFFINTLPLRVNTDHDLFTDYLAHVKQVNLDVQSHQDIPLEYLIEHCNIARSTQHMPLIEIQFSMDSTEVGELTLPGIQITSLGSGAPVARWDLNVGAQLTPHGIELAWVYDNEVFTHQRIQTLNDHFLALLNAVLAEPQASISDLQMLSAVEVDLLSVQLPAQLSGEQSETKQVHQLFEHYAQIQPDAIAVVSDHDQLSYRELNEQANQLAYHLIQQGVVADTLVGVCIERSVEVMIAIMAVLKAGGAYVPLDPKYPTHRLDYIMADSAMEFVITDSELMQSLSFEDMTLLLMDEHLREHMYGHYSTDNPMIEASASALAYVIYTSGSTGQPKGVMVEHQGVINMSLSQQISYNVTPSSRVLQFASLNFDASVLEWVMALTHGAGLYICSETVKHAPVQLSQYLVTKGITHTLIPPAMLRHLTFGPDYQFEALLVGGEACDESLAQLWSGAYPMFNAYGPTEVSVYASTGRLLPDEQVHIGRVITNTQLYVVDNSGALAPVGAVGELCVAGVGVARGYLNQPQLTDEKFIPNPFIGADETASHWQRLYKTGDLVRYQLDEQGRPGNLIYVGRMDEQVKIRGFRIELGEIEHHLTLDNTVASALVLVKEDEQGQQYLVAYVLPQSTDLLRSSLEDNDQQESDQQELGKLDNHAFVAQLKDGLKAVLPEYAVPAAFVLLEQWPLNQSGKIDRQALPEPDLTLLQGQYVAPESELEQSLVTIWAKVLGIPADSLSVTANFFELGGHSLLAARLIGEVRTVLDQELSIKMVFEAPNIRDLARLLGEQMAGSPSDLLQRSVITPIARSEDTVFRLSFAQQRLWFIDQLEQGSAHYNMPLSLQVTGQLNVAVVEQALTKVIERHESLRTRFVEQDGQPIQQIQQSFDFTLTRFDLSHIDVAEQDDAVRALILKDSTTVFDLSTDLMVRAAYIHLSDASQTPAHIPARGVLMFNMHHISSDGWSMGVLVKDFIACYQSILTGQPDGLAPMTIQYADFAHWQRQWLVGEVLDAQLNYWTKQLDDVPGVHSLPLDYPRPEIKTHQGALVSSQLDAQVSGKLQQLAKDNQLTDFMLIHAAIALVLSRHSNSDDILVGTPVANRMQGEVEPLIGFFVNTLVLRTDCNYELLADYLAHVRMVNLDAQAHQDIPFEQLVDHCNVPRSTEHTPLFQIMFNMNTNEQSNLSIPGVSLNPIGDVDIVVKFDLDISAKVTDEGMVFSWVYDTALFSHARIESLSAHLNALLTAIAQTADAIDTQLRDLSMLGSAETHYLLHQLNDTATSTDTDCLIHQWFERQVLESPDNLAVVFEQQSLTYQQLNESANRLAHHLRAQGVVENTLVGVCLQRSVEMVVAIMAILKAGGAYLPLEPDNPSERLRYMIKDAQLQHVIGHSASISASFDLANCGLIDLATAECQEQLAQYPSTNPPRLNSQDSDSLAYVIYTSGSTGQPKGVMIEHQAITNRIGWMQHEYQLINADRVLQKTPFSFDVSVWEFLWTLSYGATLVVAKPEGHKDPEYLQQLITEQQISILHFVPSMLNAYCAVNGAALPASVRCLFCSGEALGTKVVDTVQQQSPHVRLLNLYGPTEAAIDVSYFDCGQLSGLQLGSSTSVPIGKPIHNTQLYVLNDRQALLPAGTIGELYIGGHGLARGYLNQPELTAERFIHTHLNGADQAPIRIYRTGDLAKIRSDGHIEYVGRTDTQVKIRGFRIELAEIEYHLRQLDGIEDALVCVSSLKSGEQQLLAYVIPAEQSGEQAGEQVLVQDNWRSSLATSLPEHMLPSHLMVLAQWPLTANGKIDRKNLPQPQLASGVAADVPTTSGEIVLAKAWATVLEMDWQQIGRQDNFFALGGHSLLIIRYKALLAEQNYHLPVAMLYKNQTLAELAPLLNAAEQIEVPPVAIPEGSTQLTPDMLPMVTLDSEELTILEQQVHGGVGNIQDVYPLSPLQQGMLFHSLQATDADPYILKSLFKCESKASFEQFVAALNWVINRHDALRTQLIYGTLSQPVQVVCRQFELPIHQVQFTGDSDALDAFLTEYQLSPEQTLLAAGQPLMRMDVIEHGGCYYLILFNHHVVEDNLSIRNVAIELEAALNQQTQYLPQPMQYRSFVWQGMQSSSDAAEQYFTDNLAGFDEISKPFGLDVGVENVAEAKHYSALLSTELSDQIQQLAASDDVSFAAVLHLGWALVVGQTSGLQDVVFGSVLSGRMSSMAGIDNMVGMCINTLPVRIGVADGNVSDSLKQLQISLNRLVEFEQTPLTLVQNCSELANNTPLFGSILNCRLQYDLADAEDKLDFSPFGVTALGGIEYTNYPFSASADFDGQQFALSIETHNQVAPEILFDYFSNALESLVNATPQTALEQLSIMSDKQRHYLLDTLNQTSAEYPKAAGIMPLFEAQVARNAQSVALECDGEVLSYQQLNQAANRLAHYLVELGVESGSLVGVCVERSAQMVIAALAILKAGGAYVPVGKNYPLSRVQLIVDDTCLGFWLSDSDIDSDLSFGRDAQVVKLDDALHHQLNDYSDANLPVEHSGDNLAYITYTSGSTGIPKGVMVEQHAVVALVHQNQFIDDDKVTAVLALSNFAFDGSVFDIFYPLLNGKALVMVPQDQLMNLNYWQQKSETQAVNCVFMTTALFNFVVNEKPQVLDCFEQLFFGGEQCNVHDVEYALNNHPATQLSHVYGPTETTVFATHTRLTLDNYPQLPIGKPLTNKTIYVLDSQQRLTPQGAVGELYIGGVGLARGYLNKPELTQEQFIQHPFSDDPNELLYRTGDLVRCLADGDLVFVGRADNQLKIRGFRIEPGEIEHQLDAVTGVNASIVVATEDKQLVAYVAVEAEILADSDAFARQLKADMQEVLPEYMVPAAFMVLKSLPLTANGKVDKKQLPEPDFAAWQTHYVAASTATEQLLLEIWADLLKLDAETLSVEGNFFELGGHSLLVIRLLAAIERKTGIKLDIRQLFVANTIKSAAQTLDRVRARQELKSTLAAEDDETIEQMVI